MVRKRPKRRSNRDPLLPVLYASDRSIGAQQHKVVVARFGTSVFYRLGNIAVYVTFNIYSVWNRSKQSRLWLNRGYCSLYSLVINSLPNNKILDQSEFKAFADDKIILFSRNWNSFREEWKTLWEKEKMLVTSIFSFSHNVFKRPLSQGC